MQKTIADQKSLEYVSTLLDRYKVLYHAVYGDINLLNSYNFQKFCC